MSLRHPFAGLMGPQLPHLLALALCTGKDSPSVCPDKYGNSVFIGCINISDLYIHFIYHSAGPERRGKGSPSSTTMNPLPPQPHPLCKLRPRALASSFPVDGMEKLGKREEGGWLGGSI